MLICLQGDGTICWKSLPTEFFIRFALGTKFSYISKFYAFLLTPNFRRKIAANFLDHKNLIFPICASILLFLLPICFGAIKTSNSINFVVEHDASSKAKQSHTERLRRQTKLIKQWCRRKIEHPSGFTFRQHRRTNNCLYNVTLYDIDEENSASNVS
jgi:hypothetical protein